MGAVILLHVVMSLAARASCPHDRVISLPAARARMLIADFLAVHPLPRMTVGGDEVGNSRCVADVGRLNADGTFALRVRERFWKINVIDQTVIIADVPACVACGITGDPAGVPDAAIESLGEPGEDTFFIDFIARRLQIPASARRAPYQPAVLRCEGE